MSNRFARILAIFTLHWIATGLQAGERPARLAIRPPAAASLEIAEVPDHARQLLTTLAREAIPAEYENMKEWGKTKKTWDGLHMHMDGLRLKTKRRWKEANHGTWKRYRMEVVDPDEHLQLQLTNFSKREDGTLELDVALNSRVRCYGQLQKWSHDVRLFSISADARADVDVKLRCSVSTSMDLTHLPPDLLFHPQVLDAAIYLRQFELHRISHADGPLVGELGDTLEKVLRKELADRSDKLGVKMNRQIKKKEDQLRLSLHDCLKYDWLTVDGAE